VDLPVFNLIRRLSLGTYSYIYSSVESVSEINTEHRYPVVNIPALYSAGFGFKSRPGAGYTCGFPQFLQVDAGIES
jgi:hypothetical protein